MMRIRTVLLAFLILIMGFTVSQADTGRAKVETLFAQAVEAYKKGDYESSVRLNSEALAAGFESPALHYNLGNGYLRLRQVGRAIVSYLRAQRLSPGDVDIQANLNYARAMVQSPLLTKDIPWWVRPFKGVSFEELRWAALLVFMFFAAIVLLALYAGWKPRKVWGWGLTGALLVVYLIMGAGYRLAAEAGLGVCLERVEVKFEPAPQATTYFKLPEGAEIRILREKEGWFKIERPDRKSGWVPVRSVSRV